jgi:putative ABC transport system substrate-binding protein
MVDNAVLNKKHRIVFDILCQLIFFIFIFLNDIADARGKIISVQSIRVNPYEKVIRGFRRTCNADIEQLVISESNGVNIQQLVINYRPDVILAIGKQALVEVKTIKKIPIIYLMVLRPESILNEESNITGVKLYVSPYKQINIILKIFPKCEKIGIFYNPDNNQNFFLSIREAAQNRSIDLITRKFTSSKDIPPFLNNTKADYDLFWILPDPSIITPEIVESFLLFSIEKKIPLLTFSRKYVEWGAMISIGIDPYDLGSQAGEMAHKILTDVSNGKTLLAPQYARKPVVAVNGLTARKLGIHINDNEFHKLKFID